MKRTWLTFGILLLNFVLFAQQNEVLFRLGDKIISKKEIMSFRAKKDKEISIDEFNRYLNFYLSIYDFKAQKKDTTLVFKRRLESQFLGIFRSVYSAENSDTLLNKCSVEQNVFAVVKDLFVPFEPVLLQGVEEMREKGVSFDSIANYAATFEGVNLSTKLITPMATSWVFNNAACELLTGKKNVGPIKDDKGYHYLHFLREQENFGTYKTQVIYIPNLEGEGSAKIKEAYKALQKKQSFASVMKRYSEGLRGDDDDGIRYFSPALNTNKIIQEELIKLKSDGDISKPFLASGSWYIIKRLSKDTYPSKEILKRNALITTQKPSFFIEELKEKYGAKEYPQNFMNGRDEILFLIGSKAYYTEDLKQYVKEYGYNYTSESYDQFFIHLLLEKYKEELDSNRYQELIDDFYFMQVHNPLEMLKKEKKQNEFIESLRKLVKKYNPVIPNKKYVENNPVFED